MISGKLAARMVQKFVSDNAPAILTAVGAAGAVGTTVLTVKATIKAVDLVGEEKTRRFQMSVSEPANLTKVDLVKVTWKEYLPPAGMLAVTVASVVCANRVAMGRAAALAAAYSLKEKSFTEYRDKVVEKFNPNKERQVRDEIAQDHVTTNPPKDAQIIVVGSGNVTCYDQPSDRYFSSNMEKIRSTVNTVNATVNEVGDATLEEFYAALGLNPTMGADSFGWTRDRLLDVHFSSVITPDNEPCIVVDYDYKVLRSGSRFQGHESDPPF